MSELKSVYDHKTGRFVLKKEEKPANAFEWRRYAKENNITFTHMNHAAINSATISKYVEGKRKETPSHGTVFGISDKAVSVKPLEYMKKRK
jgi:hypothetical protein